MNLKLKCGGFKNNIVEMTNYNSRFGGGVQYIFRFDNKYGASVIKRLGSFGAKYNRWELAVLIFTEDGAHYITYNTPITDDVLEDLTDGEVIGILGKIRDLKIGAGLEGEENEQ